MDIESLEFLMGDRYGAHLLLRPIGRDRTDAAGDEPLVAEVEIAAGGFSGEFRPFLWAEDLSVFRDQLSMLYERLSGEAVLDSVERWIRAIISGDGRGGLVARCEATDDPGIGNQFHFILLLDQTYLPGMITGLDAILGRFPVAG